MEKPARNYFEESVSISRNGNKIIESLHRQLVKDFEFSSYELNLNMTTHSDYEQLHQTIMDVLMESIPHQADKLARLCYRIDLKESEVKNIINHNDSYLALQYLADAIIIRELKKVILKLQLQEGND